MSDRKQISKARKVTGNLLIVLAAAFTVYLSVIMIYRINTVVLKDVYSKVFRYELIVCACFILTAADVRFGFFSMMKNKLQKGIGWMLRLVVIALTVFVLVLGVKICVGTLIRNDASAEHAIVLGLALQDGKPVPDLISRIDTAQDYAQANPDAVLILTGGNPDESGRTEADVMHGLLIERGLPEDGMILEDQAETTIDNFRNTISMIGSDEPVVLISSNYHMDRAVSIARSAGFTNVLRLPAPSSPLSFGANVMWEVIQEIDAMTK